MRAKEALEELVEEIQQEPEEKWHIVMSHRNTQYATTLTKRKEFGRYLAAEMKALNGGSKQVLSLAEDGTILSSIDAWMFSFELGNYEEQLVSLQKAGPADLVEKLSGNMLENQNIINDRIHEHARDFSRVQEIWQNPAHLLTWPLLKWYMQAGVDISLMHSTVQGCCKQRTPQQQADALQ